MRRTPNQFKWLLSCVNLNLNFAGENLPIYSPLENLREAILCISWESYGAVVG